MDDAVQTVMSQCEMWTDNVTKDRFQIIGKHMTEIIILPWPGVKFCVSDFRQSQEWYWKAGQILAGIP